MNNLTQKELKGFIIDWFDYCLEVGVKPWRFDFKEAYILESIQNASDMTKQMLRYKNFELDQNGYRIAPDYQNIITAESADADKEAIAIHKVLWPKVDGDLDNGAGCIRADAVNSFITTFNAAVRKSDNYEEILARQKSELPEDCSYYDVLIHNDNYKEYSLVKDNLGAFDLFAKLTHCLGNFVLMPAWQNTGRCRFSNDYWDLTLRSLKPFYEDFDAWKSYIKTHHLEIYVDDEFEVKEYWENHFPNGEDKTKYYPETQSDFETYLSTVNEAIDLRGKYLIKRLIEKLDLKDYDYYKEINKEVSL